MACSNCQALPPGTNAADPLVAGTSSAATMQPTENIEIPHIPEAPGNGEAAKKDTVAGKVTFHQGKIKPPRRIWTRILRVLCVLACFVIVLAVDRTKDPIPWLISIAGALTLIITSFVSRSAWSYTGVVSFRHHSFPKAGNAWSAGGEGAMPIKELENGDSAAVFRLSLLDEFGNLIGDKSVHCVIEKIDYYVQEGDLVTVIGKLSDAVTKPLLINHSSQTVTEPYDGTRKPVYEEEKQRYFDIFINKYKAGWVIGWVSFLVFGFFFELGSKNPAMANTPDCMGMLLFSLAGCILLAIQSRSKLRSMVLNRYARPYIREWKPIQVRDALGVIEGVSTFKRREFQFPRNQRRSVRTWAIYRTAVYSEAGELLFRLVGASREVDLASPLRVGDWVKWVGEYKTTEVHRKPTVVQATAIGERPNA